MICSDCVPALRLLGREVAGRAPPADRPSPPPLRTACADTRGADGCSRPSASSNCTSQFTQRRRCVRTVRSWRDTDEGPAAAVDEARDAQADGRARTRGASEPAAIAGVHATTCVLPRTGFRKCFAEYRRLDDELLPLAVENSNLKAQRLSFGPARRGEPTRSRAALDSATAQWCRRDAAGAREQALARATRPVFEIQRAAGAAHRRSPATLR